MYNANRLVDSGERSFHNVHSCYYVECYDNFMWDILEKNYLLQ